jgi:hypothetical protein
MMMMMMMVNGKCLRGRGLSNVREYFWNAPAERRRAGARWFKEDGGIRRYTDLAMPRDIDAAVHRESCLIRIYSKLTVGSLYFRPHRCTLAGGFYSSAAYQMIQPPLTLAAHLFVMAVRTFSVAALCVTVH